MGILDSASSAIKGAAAGTSRATKVIQIKGQLSDIAKQRSASAAQLGASLFEETRNNSTFRASREDLYSAIEALDAQRDALQLEIAQLEQESQAAQQAAATYICPKCGGIVGATDMFCVGCGTPVAEIKQNLRLCPQCGTPIESDAAFCVGCGSPVDASVAAGDSASAAVPVAGLRTCAKCGAPLEADAAFCVGCGSPVEANDAAPEVSESNTQTDVGVVSSEPVVADMPVEESADAPKAAVEGAEEAVVADAPVDDIPGLCPKCGYENIDTAKFCFNCGNALH